MSVADGVKRFGGDVDCEDEKVGRRADGSGVTFLKGVFIPGRTVLWALGWVATQ